MAGKELDEIYDVIIVGGGISGISAARHLLRNNIDKVLLLEAETRLGGRIKTIETEYGHIDLGAEWIHGQQGNPLYDLAVDHRLVHKRRQSFYISHSSASLYDLQKFRTEDGDEIDQDLVSEISNVMENLYEMALKQVSQKPRNVTERSDVTRKNKKSISFEEHFSNGFTKYLGKSSFGNINKEIKEALYKWRLKWELTDNSCSSLDDVSFPGRYLVCDGHGITDLKAGFQTVFDVLKVDVPDQNIRLSKPVKRVIWNTNTCSVECTDSTKFQAKFVIVTVPLGYLKHHMSSMFSPPLPERKILSIQNFGFGTTTKVFLTWKKPFWTDAFSGIQFIWKSDMVKKDILYECSKFEAEEKLKSDGNPWYYDLTGFERCTGRPNMLIGWIAGEGATISSKIGDEEMTNVCTFLLKTFCNDNSIPQPNGIYRSNWERNEYVQGCYSYVSMRNTESDYEALCESLPSNKNPKVLFAGEAMSYHYYSTTHGAYESGIKSAEDIIRIEQSLVNDDN